MEDKLSIVETSQIDDKLNIILRQTDYGKDVALSKLELFNYNEVLVIKDYLGISIKEEDRKLDKNNLNNEIYKQLRKRLDGTMRSYNERKTNNETKLK